MQRDEFDYSCMSTYQTCQRKYLFRHVLGYDPKKQAMAPSFGTGIHKALDSWFKDKDVEKAVKAFKDSFVEDLEIDDKRTHKMGEWIVGNYHERYKDQTWELVHSEFAFTVDLPNGKKLIGRIDKIIKWDGCLWVVDHKTTSSLGPQYFKMSEPSLQFPGYAWAARKMGYDVKGVVVDALLVAKGLLDSSSRGRLTPLARYDVDVTEYALQQWLQTAMDIQEDITISQKSERWVPNFDACTYYGECPYRRVCLEKKEFWPRLLQSEFTVNFWDPRKETEE